METKERLKSKVDELLDWPTEFYVCPQHKRDFFADYELAIESDQQHCVICNPIETDSLGG